MSPRSCTVTAVAPPLRSYYPQLDDAKAVTTLATARPGLDELYNLRPGLFVSLTEGHRNSFFFRDATPAAFVLQFEVAASTSLVSLAVYWLLNQAPQLVVDSSGTSVSGHSALLSLTPGAISTQLYNDAQRMATGAVELSDTAWHTVEIEHDEGRITAHVDKQELASYDGVLPLSPAGQRRFFGFSVVNGSAQVRAIRLVQGTVEGEVLSTALPHFCGDFGFCRPVQPSAVGGVRGGGRSGPVRKQHVHARARRQPQVQLRSWLGGGLHQRHQHLPR